MVQVAQGAEVVRGAAHLVPDDEPALAAALDLEHLDHGPVPVLDVPHDVLVDVERVGRGALEKRLVGHAADVGAFPAGSSSLLVGERAARDKVATELLRGRGRDGACRTESFETVRALRRRVVEEQFVDSALARRARPFGARHAWRGSVDEQSAVLLARLAGRLVDFLELNLESGHVVLGESHDLGAEQSNNMVTDLVDRFRRKVGVVDAELVVEPRDLVLDEL